MLVKGTSAPSVPSHKLASAQQTPRSIDDLNLPAWVLEDAKVLKTHPAFQSAGRLHAELVSENFEKTSALIRIMSEEARYVTCIALLAMHHSRNPHDPSSGATLTRLQTFAAQFGLSGPNRIAAIVALMKHAAAMATAYSRSGSSNSRTSAIVSEFSPMVEGIRYHRANAHPPREN